MNSKLGLGPTDNCYKIADFYTGLKVIKKKPCQILVVDVIMWT